MRLENQLYTTTTITTTTTSTANNNNNKCRSEKLSSLSSTSSSFTCRRLKLTHFLSWLIQNKQYLAAVDTVVL